MKCGKAEVWVSDAVEKKGLTREDGTLQNTEQGMQPGGQAVERPPTGVDISSGQGGSQNCGSMDRVSSESPSAFCH